MKVVPNPFKDALKEIFNSTLPPVLKKKPSLMAIGELGTWERKSPFKRLFTTEEGARLQQERHGGTILPFPEGLFTLVTYEKQVLKDGFLPVHQYIYDEQMYRLANLIEEVGEANVSGVNVDCVFLKPGTAHPYHQKYNTNIYENLGRIQVEPERKRIRAPLFCSKELEPVELQEVPAPVVHRRIGKERETGAFDDVLSSSRSLLVKSPKPGSGKTQLVLDYLKRCCAGQKVCVACPTNFQARSFGELGVTLYQLTGKGLGREHLWGKKTERYDVVLLEEMTMWSYTHWMMFLEYFERNKGFTKFYATGDTKQIPPIEKNWNGDDANKMAFYERVMDEVFPVQIELLEVKRFLPQHVHIIDAMYVDFWEKMMPLGQLIELYGDSGKVPAAAMEVAYRTDVVDWVNTKAHGKKPEYHEGLVLVKSSSQSKDPIKRGYEVKVSKLTKTHAWFEDEAKNVCYLKGYTLDAVRKNFDYTYCFTGHKLQGRSFEGAINIYDADFHYACRNWLWVAMTRTRDPTQIFFSRSPVRYVLDDHYIIKKLKQYVRSEAEKGRACDLLDGGDREAIAWFRQELHKVKGRCYSPLNDCDRVLTFSSGSRDGEKFRSNLTFDRVNNEYGELRGNIRFCCEQCNERRKDKHMLE